jgi:hypothetical protein
MHVQAQLWRVLAAQLVICALAFGLVPAIVPIASSGYHDAPHVLQFGYATPGQLDGWMDVPMKERGGRGREGGREGGEEGTNGWTAG